MPSSWIIPDNDALNASLAAVQLGLVPTLESIVRNPNKKDHYTFTFNRFGLAKLHKVVDDPADYEDEIREQVARLHEAGVAHRNLSPYCIYTHRNEQYIHDPDTYVHTRKQIYIVDYSKATMSDNADGYEQDREDLETLLNAYRKPEHL